MNESEKRRFDAVVNRVPSNPESILDVGCARHTESDRQQASLHAYLCGDADRQTNVIGIDVLDDEIATMQSNGWDARVGDAERLDDLDVRVDAVVAGEVIEHLGRPVDFIESASRILTPGGRIVLTTPNPDGFAYWRKAITGQHTNETHTCWIDPANLERLVDLAAEPLSVRETTYLEPTGGISALLWRAGFVRAASPGYVAVIERTE